MPETLKKEYKFKNFSEAMEFVNKVAAIAEKQNHHPDIFISFNKVVLTFVTHEAHEVTEKDYKLASEVNNLVAS